MQDEKSMHEVCVCTKPLQDGKSSEYTFRSWSHEDVWKLALIKKPDDRWNGEIYLKAINKNKL